MESLSVSVASTGVDGFFSAYTCYSLTWMHGFRDPAQIFVGSIPHLWGMTVYNKGSCRATTGFLQKFAKLLQNGTSLL